MKSLLSQHILYCKVVQQQQQHTSHPSLQGTLPCMLQARMMLPAVLLLPADMHRCNSKQSVKGAPRNPAARDSGDSAQPFESKEDQLLQPAAAVTAVTTGCGW
jgi:hypothetical protein